MSVSSRRKRLRHARRNQFFRQVGHSPEDIASFIQKLTRKKDPTLLEASLVDYFAWASRQSSSFVDESRSSRHALQDLVDQQVFGVGVVADCRYFGKKGDGGEYWVCLAQPAVLGTFPRGIDTFLDHHCYYGLESLLVSERPEPALLRDYAPHVYGDATIPTLHHVWVPVSDLSAFPVPFDHPSRGDGKDNRFMLYLGRMVPFVARVSTYRGFQDVGFVTKFGFSDVRFVMSLRGQTVDGSSTWFNRYPMGQGHDRPLGLFGGVSGKFTLTAGRCRAEIMFGICRNRHLPDDLASRTLADFMAALLVSSDTKYGRHEALYRQVGLAKFFDGDYFKQFEQEVKSGRFSAYYYARPGYKDSAQRRGRLPSGWENQLRASRHRG